MIANYHTHTWRCHHAVGTEEEYVERAIECGLQILGFSDHTPMPYDGGFVSDSKMTFDQVEDYVDTVLCLRDKYRADIEIHLGLEVEYYPKYFDKLMSMLSDYPMEYFILGQHFLGNQVGDVFCMAPTDREEDIKRYSAQVREAMATGKFLYLAHPDVIQYIGPDEIYDRYMRDICEDAKRLHIPLEINLLGAEEDRHYPNPGFWRIAGEVGNDVILGSDAHTPQAVYRPEALKKAEKLVDSFGLKLIETIKL